MNNETLLDKAVQNLNCATIIFNSNLVQDEVYLNYVGYHLQQAVELSIKYTLENNGVEYNKQPLYILALLYRNKLWYDVLVFCCFVLAGQNVMALYLTYDSQAMEKSAAFLDSDGACLKGRRISLGFVLSFVLGHKQASVIFAQTDTT